MDPVTELRQQPPENLRSKSLRLANEAVNGDRNAQYGDPDQDFQRTSGFWNIYIGGVLEKRLHDLAAEAGEAYFDPRDMADLLDIVRTLLQPHDVAWMMNLLKTSRSIVSPGKLDHYVDGEGYLACGAECAGAQ